MAELADAHGLGPCTARCAGSTPVLGTIMTNAASPDYGKITEEQYVSKFNSPSQSKEYFSRFHEPLIKEVDAKSSSTEIILLDIGCGYGYELDLIGDSTGINIIGVDISNEVLRSAQKRLPNVSFVTSDAENLPMSDDSIDCAIAVNAVIYKPDKILSSAFRVLKPHAKFAVNFRVFEKETNRAFYDYCEKFGALVADSRLTIQNGNEKVDFDIKVVDYTQCPNENNIRSLGRQIYFKTEQDVEKLISLTGFRILKHDTFQYASPGNERNETDVYILQKP